MKAVFGTAPSTNGFLVEYEATVASAKILGIQSEFALAIRYECWGYAWAILCQDLSLFKENNDG